MSIIVNNGVDMASIKCLTLKGAAPNRGDIKLIKTIAESYHALETLDLSGVQMETVEGFREIAIKAVILPKCAVSIGEEAFYKCKALNQITIPASVTSIGKEAFFSCESLKLVGINSKMPFKLESSVFDFCHYLLRIVVPKGTLPFFKMSWSNYSYRIVESEK